ncbi:MAG: type II secretion system protein GspD [Gemmatimonadales bacterium]
MTYRIRLWTVLALFPCALAPQATPTPSITVGATGIETSIRWAVPRAAVVTDSLRGADRTIAILARGISIRQRATAPVRAGGIIDVAVEPVGDTAVSLLIRVTDIRPYRVERDSLGAVVVTMDGVGEHLDVRTIALEPIAAPVTGGRADSAGRGGAQGRTRSDSAGRRAPEDLSVDARTLERLRAWDPPALQPFTARWDHTPLRDLLAAFSEAVNHSVLPGSGVDSVLVSAEFRSARWPAVLQTLARSYSLRLRIIDGDILTVETASAKADDLTPLEMRVFQTSYEKPDQLAAALKEHVSKRGAVTSIPERGLVLVRDTPDALDAVSDVVRALDRAPRQIRIAYTLLSIDRSIASDLGAVIDVADATGGNSLGALPLPGAAAGTPGAVNVARNRASGAVAATLPLTANPTFKALLTGLAGNLSVATLVTALEQKGLAKVVSRQYGVVTEGEEHTGNSGKRTPLRVQGVTGGFGQPFSGSGASAPSAPGQSQGAGVPFNTVSLVETGSKLTFTPRIQGDDVVSVRLRVERSSAVPSGIGDAGVEFQQTIYETSLRLHTGRTGVMGGLREILETKTESGVPGLMHLPGIGRLFRSTQSSGADRELVVLLTAVIVE